MKNIPIKKHWIDRAIDTESYHIDKCKTELHIHYKYWSIEQTANELHRSVGSIVEDLMIASWMKTHEDKIRKFKNRTDAINFIREMKQKQKLTPYQS